MTTSILANDDNNHQRMLAVEENRHHPSTSSTMAPTTSHYHDYDPAGRRTGTTWRGGGGGCGPSETWLERIPQSWHTLFTSNILERMCCISDTVIRQQVVDDEYEDDGVNDSSTIHRSNTLYHDYHESMNVTFPNHKYDLDDDDDLRVIRPSPTLVSSPSLQEHSTSWMVSESGQNRESTQRNKNTFVFLDQTQTTSTAHDENNVDKVTRNKESYPATPNKNTNKRGTRGRSTKKTDSYSPRSRSCSGDRSTSDGTVTTANDSWSSFPSLEPCYSGFWSATSPHSGDSHTQLVSNQRTTAVDRRSIGTATTPTEIVLVPTTKASSSSHVRRWSDVQAQEDVRVLQQQQRKQRQQQPPSLAEHDHMIIRQVQSECWAELPYLNQTQGFEC